MPPTSMATKVLLELRSRTRRSSGQRSWGDTGEMQGRCMGDMGEMKGDEGRYGVLAQDEEVLRAAVLG